MCRRIKTNGHETFQGAIDEWERLCEDARKIELEPCPCCGKIPTCTNCPDKEYSKFFIVSCTNPDCAYKEVAYGQTEIGAKKNWSYYCEQKRKEKNG